MSHQEQITYNAVMTNRQNKLFDLLRLMDYMLKGKELYALDEHLQDELGVSYETLLRYLKEIKENYGDVIVCDKQNRIKEGRQVTIYRTIDPAKDLADILNFFINNDAHGMGYLMKLIHDNKPSVFKELEEDQKRALELQAKKDRDAVLFRTNPLENLMDDVTEKNLKELKKAVKNHEYRNFDYTYNQHSEILEDLKCLKLIFMNAR
jgi:hypothetical protein